MTLVYVYGSGECEQLGELSKYTIVDSIFLWVDSTTNSSDFIGLGDDAP